METEKMIFSVTEFLVEYRAGPSKEAPSNRFDAIARRASARSLAACLPRVLFAPSGEDLFQSVDACSESGKPFCGEDDVLETGLAKLTGVFVDDRDQSPPLAWRDDLRRIWQPLFVRPHILDLSKYGPLEIVRLLIHAVPTLKSFRCRIN